MLTNSRQMKKFAQNLAPNIIGLIFFKLLCDKL